MKLTVRLVTLLIWAGVMGNITPLLAQKDKNTIAYTKQPSKLRIPLDPDVRTGKLANGFQYFILRNTEPKDRMVMYLANKVGAMLETDKQLGLAHFLEHMNFNGTVHFPKNQLVDYLQSAGIRFGADLNAYTGFDETVYQLPLPSNNPELVKQGLVIMRDWANGALLEGEEIDQERGVILEEKRQRGGLSDRIQEKSLPMFTNGSRYAHRLPIGTEEVLKNFDHKEIRDFYKKWYRPELQALIVVGDIDEVAMEKEIIRLFSDLKNPKKAPKRTYYNIALTGKNQYLEFTDEEITSVNLQIAYKTPAFQTYEIKDYKTSLERGLFASLLNERLGELTRDINTPFLSAGVGTDELFGGLEMHTIGVAPKPGKLKESIYAVYKAFEQARQYGFTESELERAKINYVASLENSLAEKDKVASESYVDDILNYYLKGRPAPAFDFIYPILKKNIEELQLSDIHKHAALYVGEKNRDMILLAPKNIASTLPTEQQLLDWIADAAKVNPEPYREEVVSEELIVDLPAQGKIVQEQKNETVGTKTLVLDNGVRVVLKPTDFKNDEIMVTSYSPGGYSLYDTTDFQSAVNAVSIVSSSGLGPFNSLQLSKYLSGKNLSVSPFISEIGEGIKAFSTQKDLKTMFELIHAYFYQTRLDRNINEANMEKSKLALENKYNEPAAFFRDSIAKLLYNNDPRKTGATIEKIDQINMDRSWEIFKDRFADASDFTFVIVGNFTEEQILPYVTQYLATLPNLGRKEKFVDNASYPPAKGISANIYKGHEDKATVTLAYLGEYEYNEKNNLLMEALASNINVILLQRLREKEGGIYSIGVSPSLEQHPRMRFGLHISFTTDPNQVEKLLGAVEEEIEKIKSEGITQEELDKFIAERTLGHETAIRENNFWLSFLLSSTIEQKDPVRVFEFDKQLKNLSKDAVQEMAKRYLSKDRLFQFVLYPEK